MSDLPPAWALRADYIDEAEMALNRTTDEWPGLADNPVWKEVLRHFRSHYRTGGPVEFSE